MFYNASAMPATRRRARDAFASRADKRRLARLKIPAPSGDVVVPGEPGIFF